MVSVRAIRTEEARPESAELRLTTRAKHGGHAGVLEITSAVEKEIKMKATERGARRELFESIGDDGTRWAFVIRPDDRWAITRNGESVAFGTTERRSIEAGVGKYVGFAHGVAGKPPVDPVVQKHLDLIDGGSKSHRTATASGTAK